MKSSGQFYQDLPECNGYGEMLDIGSYSDLPDDWVLVLSDVQGSTAAIEAGHYKQVNTIGVACIVAVQNALGDLDFPFLFGGDGATMALPESHLKLAAQALAHVRNLAKSEFVMNLRLAAISVGHIRAQGHPLKVAKLRISPLQCLAMYRGSGWSLAEELLKSTTNTHSAIFDTVSAGGLNGLECRWNPLPAKQSQVMALIVQSRGTDTDSVRIYSDILASLQVNHTKPASLETFRFTWPPKFLMVEARLRSGTGLRRWLYLLAVHFKVALLTLLVRARGQKNVTDPIGYIQEMTKNTDYLKFDDCLRVILDVSDQQKTKILNALNTSYQRGDIFFGAHFDTEALLTCFIRSPKKHIHFIDAAGGGYAKAAQQLKSQKRLATTA